MFSYILRILRGCVAFLLGALCFPAWTHAWGSVTGKDSFLFDKYPNGTILQSSNTDNGIVPILIFAQSILLKIVLPVVVVGAGLWIAFQLLTAEGDETKMKKAWKSVAYSAVALIAIGVSYAFIGIVTRISI